MCSEIFSWQNRANDANYAITISVNANDIFFWYVILRFKIEGRGYLGSKGMNKMHLAAKFHENY